MGLLTHKHTRTHTNIYIIYTRNLRPNVYNLFFYFLFFGFKWIMWNAPSRRYTKCVIDDFTMACIHIKLIIDLLLLHQQISHTQIHTQKRKRISKKKKLSNAFFFSFIEFFLLVFWYGNCYRKFYDLLSLRYIFTEMHSYDSVFFWFCSNVHWRQKKKIYGKTDKWKILQKCWRKKKAKKIKIHATENR